MRALLVTDSFPPRCGGSGWSVDALARGLANAVESVEVIHRTVAERPSFERGARDGMVVWRISAPDVTVPVLRDAYRAMIRDRALEAAIGARVAAFRPDMMHAQQGSNFAPVARAAHRFGLTAVATVRDYAPICLRTTRFSEGAVCSGCSAPRLSRCFADRYGAAGWALAPLVPAGLAATRARTRALDRFARVIAVSGYVRDRLRESGVEAPIDVLSNLPPVAPVAPPRPPNAPPAPYVVFAGKLNREKGADLLPRVASSLPARATLVVLGDGALAGLLDEAMHRGAPIMRLGSVPNDEVLAWIAHARCLLLPSRWPEPASRLILEAGAVGTPVAALATGGTPEIVTDGENGILANDAEQLVQATARLVTDEALHERLARGTRDRASRFASGSAILAQVIDTYRRAAGRAGPLGVARQDD